MNDPFDDDALVARGGLCAPLFASPANAYATPIKALLPHFAALHELDYVDRRTDEEKRAAEEKRRAEAARRAQPITVTLTVGEWEDMQEASRWG